MAPGRSELLASHPESFEGNRLLSSFLLLLVLDLNRKTLSIAAFFFFDL